MNQLLLLPYATYWIPFILAMVIGCLAFGVSKLMLPRRTNSVKTPEAHPERPVDPCDWYCADEKRLSPRRSGNPTDVHLALPGRKETPQRAWVVDRSLGGLCLNVTEELAEGTQISILPIHAPEMTHWIDLEVRDCRKTEDGWEAGCSFRKTPPFSILLMLG